MEEILALSAIPRLLVVIDEMRVFGGHKADTDIERNVIARRSQITYRLKNIYTGV